MQHRSTTVLALVLASAGLAAPASTCQAAESFDSCTGYITALPATVKTPGTWCLKQNLSTGIATGNAVSVASNNVTIDCNGFKIDGSAAGTATKAVGVRSSGRLNTTLRHCTVDGFYMGAYLTGTGGGHLVEDNHFDGNTFVGAWVEGGGSVVQRNQMLDTGGSTVAGLAEAIHAKGSVDVIDNLVVGVFTLAGSTGSPAGIYTAYNAEGSVSGNRVRSIISNGSGAVHGIYNTTSGRMSLSGNELTGNASAGSIGLRCTSANDRARDNIVNGYETPLLTCGDAGNNDLTP